MFASTLVGAAFGPDCYSLFWNQATTHNPFGDIRTFWLMLCGACLGFLISLVAVSATTRKPIHMPWLLEITACIAVIAVTAQWWLGAHYKKADYDAWSEARIEAMRRERRKEIMEKGSKVPLSQGDSLQRQ